MTAFPDFTLGLAGTGVEIDPAAGTLTLSAAALAQGLGFTLTARDATGAATSAFRITLALRDDAEAEARAPVLTGAPALSGAGLIGQPVTLDPGQWSGTPAPELELRWLRDGAEIPGATGPDYLPGAADDGALLGARVIARNSAGEARAEAAPLAITHVAPSAVGELPDLVLVQGTGFHRVEAGAAFAGMGLAFSVAGPGAAGGAVIDPASGALDLPLGALRAAEEVIVTARNSGGAAQARFAVGVISAVPAPAAAGAPADQLYPLGAGARTISTQAHFSGADLVYALEVAPPGVTIQPGSGLVSVPTGQPLGGPVTVRATNAGGVATLSFRAEVRSMATDFTTASGLADMSFLASGAAPSWSFDAQGFARLVPATTGRTHGIWSKAGGDGLYRSLTRWSAANASASGVTPFVLGARIARVDGSFAGACVEVFRPASAESRGIRIQQYTGAGDAVTLLASKVTAWAWDTFYWVEVEVAGSRIRARYYAEADTAPDWMVEAETTVPAGSGGFGPGAFPLAGVSPTVLVKRIEFSPIEAETPAAAQDGDWSLAQVTE